MTRSLPLAAAVCLALLGGCVVAPYPSGYPVTESLPPSFDRSWDAAQGAAAEAGIQISRADRANGVISGSKGGAAVTIVLQRQPDNSLRVSIDAPDAQERNPTLNERWLSAYQRRMGR